MPSKSRQTSPSMSILSTLLLLTSAATTTLVTVEASPSSSSAIAINAPLPRSLHHDIALRNSLGHAHHLATRRSWEQRDPTSAGTRTEKVPGFTRRRTDGSGRVVLDKRQDQTTVVPESFEFVGNSGVSAQMMYTTGGNKVYILDKTEDNPISVTSAVSGITHPAWGVEYDVSTNEYRIMDVESNTFCAGGSSLGNGTWAVFGGNQPVTTGGVATTSTGAYDDEDGGTAIRLLTPCTNESCSYVQGTQPLNTSGDTDGWLQMTSRRWYPTVETLADGSLIVIGGDGNGGYVNTAEQDNPTYEFFPPQSTKPVNLTWLSENLPVNLYPLTWLLPQSGLLFMQANLSTIILDPSTNDVTTLPTMPYATRVYPASAATAMLPLTPANNYTATILFCGGSNPPQWGTDGGPGYNVTAVQADATCVNIQPEAASPAYSDDDSLDQGRSMGQFVYLPTGELFMSGGVAMGTAGYGNQNYSVGESYGQNPIYSPALYDPTAASGSRWRFNLTASSQERMYHSTSLLLPDGSVFISGSNPNADRSTDQWATQYTTERWYPSWYNEARPSNAGLPSSIGYGGNYFNLTLNTTDEAIVQTVQVVLIRQPFVTHVISFGLRYVQLETSYSINMNTGTTTLFVSQLRPLASVAAPGPGMLFVIVDGVPSVGVNTMIGSGSIETQPVNTVQTLPSSVILAVASSSSTTTTTTSSSAGSSSTGQSTSTKSGASTSVKALSVYTAVAGLLAVCACLL